MTERTLADPKVDNWFEDVLSGDPDPGRGSLTADLSEAPKKFYPNILDPEMVGKWSGGTMKLQLDPVEQDPITCEDQCKEITRQKN